MFQDLSRGSNSLNSDTVYIKEEEIKMKNSGIQGKFETLEGVS